MLTTYEYMLLAFSSSLLLPILLIVCLGSLMLMMGIENKSNYTPFTRMAMKFLFYACAVSAVLILGIVTGSLFYS